MNFGRFSVESFAWELWLTCLSFSVILLRGVDVHPVELLLKKQVSKSVSRRLFGKVSGAEVSQLRCEKNVGMHPATESSRGLLVVLLKSVEYLG